MSFLWNNPVAFSVHGTFYVWFSLPCLCRISCAVYSSFTLLLLQVRWSLLFFSTMTLMGLCLTFTPFVWKLCLFSSFTMLFTFSYWFFSLHFLRLNFPRSTTNTLCGTYAYFVLFSDPTSEVCCSEFYPLWALGFSYCFSTSTKSVHNFTQ